MKITMFPGQGSQSKGMGADLFDRFPQLTAQADDILGYSIKTLCLDDPRDELGQTRFTQPALYVVNALSYYRTLEDTGRAPDVVAGHSLGEFNALLAAGCFDFATGLKLVGKRGELMGQVSGGAMAAVMNATKDEIETKLRDAGLHNVYLANYNTPSQIVISGAYDEIAKAEELFQEGKMRYYPLATSGAFHSAFMADAMAQFQAFLADFAFAAPAIPVIANVTARPYDVAAMQGTLASQIASTVRWSESMQYLMALALAQGEEAEFEEVGNGDVLTRMAFTIKGQTPEALLRDILAAENVEARTVAPAAPAAPAASVHDKVAAWNRAHRIGSRVKSTAAGYDALETRTEAMVLFGHRAAVYMQGYNGYFDLDELVPA
ncbi:ACP S-malonyltransferase [Massilia rhizosphaerae]|uniref:ACP S-malonyltransferase n=1 Tax=Massilia rhizosphaerae TaxID=2784389 RepID=UPI0018DDAA36|nr:ACP S-malonyltransferase [Massilia rhizosphaerae]